MKSNFNAVTFGAIFNNNKYVYNTCIMADKVSSFACTKEGCNKTFCHRVSLSRHKKLDHTAITSNKENIDMILALAHITVTQGIFVTKQNAPKHKLNRYLYKVSTIFNVLMCLYIMYYYMY